MAELEDALGVSQVAQADFSQVLQGYAVRQGIPHQQLGGA
jgi:hypothetical protein